MPKFTSLSLLKLFYLLKLSLSIGKYIYFIVLEFQALIIGVMLIVRELNLL